MAFPVVFKVAASFSKGRLAPRLPPGRYRQTAVRFALCGILWGAAVVLGSTPVGAQTQADPERTISRPPVGASPILANGSGFTSAAVTANPLASQAALEMLRVGGNALDGAIAAQFVLNVVEPQSSGIGGGGFLLVFLPDEQKVATIDGRETAPRGVKPDLFIGPDGTLEPFYPDRITGGKSAGVPGLVWGLFDAHRHHGKLPWSQLLGQAIRLAEEGFVVSPRLAALLEDHKQRLSRFPATRSQFFDPQGNPLKAGVVLRQPDLARTLRLIADQGESAFYKGDVARDIVAAVRDAPYRPGTMTLQDLSGYRPVWRKPLYQKYHGYTLAGFPPPTSGGVTLFQMLRLLEDRFPPPNAKDQPAMPDKNGPYQPQVLHDFVVAARLAYADRGAYIADPAFWQVPVKGLLNRDYLSSRGKRVDWNGPLTPVQPGLPPGFKEPFSSLGRDGEHVSTTHLSVADAKGMVVSLTSSIEQAFGSGMVVAGRGFLLNNQLTDFSEVAVDEEGEPFANRAAPGKRPRSSMAPTLVFYGDQPVGALGSPGGPRIIQYVAWTFLMLTDWGMDPQGAVAAPHITHLGEITSLEPDPRTRAAQPRLKQLGHTVQMEDQNSGLHILWRRPGEALWQTGVDPRREGAAAGFQPR